MRRIKYLISILTIIIIIALSQPALCAEPVIIFLDTETARATIIDEVNRPYFSRLQTLEMSSKTGSEISGETIEEKRQECMRRYQAGVMEWTQEEQEALKYFIGQVHELIKDKYPDLAAFPWKFLKVSSQIEGGLPHTRSDVIIFSDMVSQYLSYSMNEILEKEEMKEPILSGWSELLTHEKIHVYQFANLDKFDNLYTDILGFIKADNIKGFELLNITQLINPDGPDCPWVMPVINNENTTYIWPLITFTDGPGPKKMGRDFRMVGIQLAKDGNNFSVKLDSENNPFIFNLSDIEGYNNSFSLLGTSPIDGSKPKHGLPNFYHPNEITASLFGMLIQFDNFIPKEKMSEERVKFVEERLKLFRKWAEENL